MSTVSQPAGKLDHESERSVALVCETRRGIDTTPIHFASHPPFQQSTSRQIDGAHLSHFSLLVGRCKVRDAAVELAVRVLATGVECRSRGDRDEHLPPLGAARISDALHFLLLLPVALVALPRRLLCRRLPHGRRVLRRAAHRWQRRPRRQRLLWCIGAARRRAGHQPNATVALVHSGHGRHMPHGELALDVPDDLGALAALAALAQVHGRGAQRERLAARWYCKWMHTLTVTFFLAETGHTIYNHDFDTRSYRILVSGNMIQIVALVYVTHMLLSLKLSGRKYETINGAQVASPLYRRTKGIMIVYGLFSFQYQIISLVLLCSNFQVEIPTLVIGVGTLLFSNSGTGLAIAIGCSQECFFRSFYRYFPEDYTEAFYVSNPSLPMNSGANRNTSPLHNPVFVYTDIESSMRLWGLGNGATMKRANEIHEQIVRSTLAEFRGYEITTAGDAFQLAFHNVKDAVEYCVQVQFKLLEADWLKKLHNLIPLTAPKKTKAKKLVFSGLRLRVGTHDAQQADGVLVNDIHPVTGKVTYTGLSEVIANEISDVGVGGQICVTLRIAKWIGVYEKALKAPCEVELVVSKYSIPQLDLAMDIFQVIPRGLESRKKTYQKFWTMRLEAIKVSAK